MDKLTQLKAKVEETFFNRLLRNYRDEIPVTDGQLVVFGYENEGLCAYIYIGEFIGGDLYCHTCKNSLILLNKHIVNDKVIEEKFIKDEKEQCADAMSWWRVPTDDECKLYYQYYPQYEIIKHINRVLEEYEIGCGIDEDYVIDIFKQIKNLIK